MYICITISQQVYAYIVCCLIVYIHTYIHTTKTHQITWQIHPIVVTTVIANHCVRRDCNRRSAGIRVDLDDHCCRSTVCLGKYHVSFIDCRNEVKKLSPLVQAKRNASLSGSFVAIIQSVRQIILSDDDTCETLGEGYIYSMAYVNSILHASHLVCRFSSRASLSISRIKFRSQAQLKHAPQSNNNKINSRF